MVLKNRWGLLEVCVRVSEYGSPSPSPSPSSSVGVGIYKCVGGREGERESTSRHTGNSGNI